jgi:hypothetical protein
MSGVSTPSLRLSSTVRRVLPPRRLKACSCSSAHVCALDFQVKSRTDFREYPSVSTKSRVRLYFPVAASRTIGPSP